jgi:hypothetical protein
MKYIITFFLLFPVLLFSQENRYSYSFSGEIDSVFVEELSRQIINLKGVKEAKGRYKIEKKRGEIIIFTNESKDENNQNPFNPSLVKEVFIKNKLTPLDFRKLN